MWQRQSFHECAAELRGLSADFCAGYLRHDDRSQQEMRSASEQGVEILRLLSLSVQSDPDYGVHGSIAVGVGSLISDIDEAVLAEVQRNYAPPSNSILNARPLSLREAMDKIASAEPDRASFFVNHSTHDLLLSGRDPRDRWLAVLSIHKLCDVLQTLPDRKLRAW